MFAAIYDVMHKSLKEFLKGFMLLSLNHDVSRATLEYRIGKTRLLLTLASEMLIEPLLAYGAFNLVSMS